MRCLLNCQLCFQNSGAEKFSMGAGNPMMCLYVLMAHRELKIHHALTCHTGSKRVNGQIENFKAAHISDALHEKHVEAQLNLSTLHILNATFKSNYHLPLLILRYCECSHLPCTLRASTNSYDG